jgi:hypothetical protein
MVNQHAMRMRHIILSCVDIVLRVTYSALAAMREAPVLRRVGNEGEQFRLCGIVVYSIPHCLTILNPKILIITYFNLYLHYLCNFN